MTITDEVWALYDRWYEDSGIDPEEINSGGCRDFARQLVEAVGRGEVIYRQDHGHAAALIDGRYYDSETPDGADIFEELNSVVRWNQ